MLYNHQITQVLLPEFYMNFTLPKIAELANGKDTRCSLSECLVRGQAMAQ